MVTSRHTHPALAAIVACAACHHAHTVKTTPEPAPAPAAPVAQVKPTPAPVPVTSNLNASDDLVRKCELHFANQQEAPKFDFDHFELTSQDRDVLQQIADCVTRGPLKGHTLQLVGRTDPRGTEEYNLGLGDRRANSVGNYLEHLGVGSQAIHTTTRGSTDATGHDETTWRVDRRVDVDLN